MRLRAAVSRLGRLLAACSMRRHAVGTADRQERVPPRMMAQVQSAVREVVVYASNVSLTINAARGSHVAVYISPGPDSEDKDERKEEKKAEAPSPPETGEEPKKKRTRGKVIKRACPHGSSFTSVPHEVRFRVFRGFAVTSNSSWQPL